MLTVITIAYSSTQNPFTRLRFSNRLRFIILFVIILLAYQTSFDAVSAQYQEPSPSILITEVFYNTPGVDAEQEWLELANFGAAPLDISNYKIGDEEQSQGGEGMLRFPQGSQLNPGAVIVISQSARGFRALYGRNPDFEINDSDPQIPNMRRYLLWSVGELALNNDGDELLLLDENNRIVDAINYGDKSTYFDPTISTVYPGQSIERVPASCDTDSAANWQPSQTPEPGSVKLEGECIRNFPPPSNGQELLSIGQIQGKRDISPRINQKVTFRGIVTGQLEDRNSEGIKFYTLFVQDMPGSEDGDPLTSDGIAVFLGRQPPSYRSGDLLQVTGQVTEFYGLTEIDDRQLEINLVSSSNPLPQSMPLDLPQDIASRNDLLESRESMLVAAADPARVVGPTHPGCGFAIIDAQTGHSPMPRRNATDPIDQPLLVLYRSDVDCRALPDLKSGDLVSTISGPLTYHFNQYKIVLQDVTSLELSPAPWNEHPQPFQPKENQFTIATFNLNNHFDGTKDMPASAEPLVSSADLAVKQRKLAFTLGQSLGCPTIVALQEIEKEQLLHDLVEETAPFCGFTYQISHQDSSDSRGLDLAFLTDPRRVQLDALNAMQACTSIDTGIVDSNAACPSSESPLFSRPPLRLDLHVDGHPYILINNHLKSKREGEEETADRRLQQSEHIAKQTRSILAADPHASIVVLGDFNDYENSLVMRKMTVDAGLTNALSYVPEHERYTYIFDGIPQLLDGILVSEELLRFVAGAMIIHTNADYPVGLAEDTTLGSLPYQASDHDLPLVLVDLPLGEVPVSTVVAEPPSPTSDPLTMTPPAPSIESSARQLPLWPLPLTTLAAAAIIVLFFWRKGR